jgi:hypothetical protein
MIFVIFGTWIYKNSDAGACITEIRSHSGKVHRRQRGHISPSIAEQRDIPAFLWLANSRRRYGRVTGTG